MKSIDIDSKGAAEDFLERVKYSCRAAAIRDGTTGNGPFSRVLLAVNTARVLNFTAVVPARYPGTASHRAAGDADVRIAGHERVGQVIKLHAKLELHPLSDLEILHQGRVKLPETRTAQTIVYQRIRPRSVGRKALEDRRVEVQPGRNVLGRIAAYGR